MSIKWQTLMIYILVNSLSLLLFWVGTQVYTGWLVSVNLSTIILSTVLPSGIILWLAGYYKKRLDKLCQNVKAISRGQFQSLSVSEASDELGLLSEEILKLSYLFKRSIQKNEQEFEKNQAILAGMLEGVIALDQVGRVMLMNHSAEKIFQKNLDQVKMKYIAEFMKNEEVENLVQLALESSQSGSTELEYNKFILRLHISPIQGGHTRPRGVVIVCFDITEIRHLEQLRTEFVGNVSHELRTPLTSIKGFVETLLDGAAEDPAIRDRFLKIIESETRRLQRLIDDLLSLSQIENRKEDVFKGQSFVQEAFEKISPVIEPYAKAKGITLEVRVSADIPPVIMGIDLLSQVLLNLMENAVKYTVEGKVWLHVFYDDSYVHIECGDTGCGIPKTDLPRVFERFYRVDKARSREEGGSGLGLSIVKHIVEGSKGKISVSSQVDIGSVFYCALPIANGEEAYEEEE